MNELAENFYKWAKENGWNVELSDKKQDLPKHINERYKFIPSDWLEFVQCFKTIVNGADNIWFNLPDDFANENAEFQWNEFELICLDSIKDEDGENSETWLKETREFWDNYLPIVMSVASGYHYYAIGIKTGEIFEGRDPEFEEIEIVTSSFTDFIEKIISGKVVLN